MLWGYFHVKKKPSLLIRIKISSSRRISKGAENTRCGLQKIWNFVRSAWIKMYNSHTELKSYTGGSRMTKGRSTTCEERIALVRECIEKGYNYGEIVKKYKVGYQQIYT